MKVLISTSTFGEFDSEPLEILKRAGLEFKLNPYGRKLEKKEIVELAIDTVGIIAGTEPLSRDVLEKLKNLKAISRCGVGMDSVDLKAAKELGIKVYNTPEAPTQAVAELTLGLIISCLRKIPQNDREIKQGQWPKLTGELLAGKTVGIIGLGRIGKSVCRLLKPFGVNILAYDIAPQPENLGQKMVSLEKLLTSSDIITLHLPGEAGCPIDEKAIAKMKNGAFLINAARGNLIDENALYEALKSGKLSLAAIDTPSEEPYKGKLRELDNVVLTAHIGSYAKEARIEMEKQAVINLLDGLNIKTI
ncbi:MAG: phosphoglycerate dehydrogenase [Candidatus Nealsonbacteria bacterium]|nr:phosphoglycerate dehydrogenase [Candidatus Nealsonbacteria bacterium]